MGKGIFKEAQRVALMPYKDATIELEKLHDKYNADDWKKIHNKVMEITRGDPDRYGNPYLKQRRTKVGVDTKEGIKKYLSINGTPSIKEIREQNPNYTQIYSEDVGVDDDDEDLEEWLNAPEDGETGWFKRAKRTIDTNDNGKIEKDEMADFQKSLDDYAAKNKKGRDDIPATYKR